MANGHDRDRADAILQAARSKSKKNVFFIGPYGRRVSFASQQRRALNVVWALTKSREWPAHKPIPRIAVVGGGIAGVMAAAALIMRHCSVQLFEKEGHVLQLQELADHRTVHPSLNFWPHEELRCTTALPFFDWYPGTAQRVLEMMREEWSYFDDHLSNIPEKNEVLDYEWDAAAKQVNLKLAGGGVAHADLVIVASGFGKEKNLGDEKQFSYWTPDGVDDLARQLGRKFLVSGTGDGGLIDTLRLTYPGFMVDDLTMQYLGLIDSKRLRDSVKDIENAAIDVEDLDERATLYKTLYCDLAYAQPLKAKRILPRLPAGKEKVELVGEFAWPFEVGSAPIHKLIIAHALNDEAITFIQGKLYREKGEYHIERKDGSRHELKRDRIVVRHGTHDPMADMLGSEALELRAIQEKLGDYLRIVELKAGFFSRDEVYRHRSRKCPHFVGMRHKLADAFMQSRHGYFVKVAQRANGIRYFVAGRSPAAGKPAPPAGTRDLFGIPLEIIPDVAPLPSDGVRRR